MSKGKYLLLGAGVAGLLAGSAYLYNLNRLSSELEVIVKGSIDKLTLSGMVLRVDVTLKNPTKGSITVKHPFVKLIYNGNTFGTSDVKDTDYEIPKYGQMQLDPIFINLSFLNLASNAPAMLKEYRSKGNVNIDINVVSTLNNRIAYSKTNSITIGKKA